MYHGIYSATNARFLTSSAKNYQDNNLQFSRPMLYSHSIRWILTYKFTSIGGSQPISVTQKLSRRLIFLYTAFILIWSAISRIMKQPPATLRVRPNKQQGS